MSSKQYRLDLDRKRRQAHHAEKKAGDYRSTESKKRSEGARARIAAQKSGSETTRNAKLREAERRDKEAESAGREASRWQARAAGYRNQELSLVSKIASAERAEAVAIERKRNRGKQQEERRAREEKAALERRVSSSEAAVAQVLRTLPAPKPEKLRVLLLGASSEGDLRVGREQKRIRAAALTLLYLSSR